jgi:hypothetical protein
MSDKINLIPDIVKQVCSGEITQVKAVSMILCVVETVALEVLRGKSDSNENRN